MPGVDSHPCLCSLEKPIPCTFGWVGVEPGSRRGPLVTPEALGGGGLSTVACVTPRTERGRKYLSLEYCIEEPYTIEVWVFQTGVKGGFPTLSSWELGSFLILAFHFRFFRLPSMCSASVPGVRLTASGFFRQVVIWLVLSITEQPITRPFTLPLQ